MRERLTAAFVLITLVLLVGAGLVRSYVVTGELRERETDVIASVARSIGQVLAYQTAGGGRVDEDLLSQFVVPGVRLVYEQPGRSDLVLTGPDYTATEDEQVVTGTVVTSGGTLTVSRVRAEPVGILWRGDKASTIGLVLLLSIIAGLVGYVVARGLAEPFRQLALAAAALGRGRFDLDLPDTRVPEARAIAQALDSSAGQLRDRLEREREFGLLASHVLRTPLTSLRLNLEELVADPTMSDDARETALGCLTTVGRIGEVAGELVEVSGRGVLVAGAALPLSDLATQVSQRWARELERCGRRLTAAVDGDLDLLFTPGPVEQVLDLVLEDVLRHHDGAVRLVFDGQTTTLAVDITCEDPEGRMVAPSEPLADRTSVVLAALGGLIETSDGLPGEKPALRVLLPRR